MYIQITHGSHQNADSDPEVWGEAGESLSNKLPGDPDPASLWATLLGIKVLRMQCYFPTKNVLSFTHQDTNHQMLCQVLKINKTESPRLRRSPLSS